MHLRLGSDGSLSPPLFLITSMNPIPALQEALRARVYTAVPPAGTNERALALTVIFSVSLVLVMLSLVVRVWKGEFWLFRRKNMGAGTFLHPHPLTTYLVGITFFLGGQFSSSLATVCSQLMGSE